MSKRVQFLRYDVGYQPTENLVTQPPDKGSNVLPTLTTDLSKAYQELEEKVSILPKLSGLTLDDFIERLAAGFTLVPPKKQNQSLADLVKETTNADRIRGMSDEELAEWIYNGISSDPCDYCKHNNLYCDGSPCQEKTGTEIIMEWLK